MIGLGRAEPQTLPSERAPARPGGGARRYDLADLVDGQVVQTPEGACLLVERSYPLPHRHGRLPLGSACVVGKRSLALLARASPELDLEISDLAFLDTETTGLSGGTGTYAFMVGIGRFEADRFVVRQAFMRDFGEEAALLHVVDRCLAGARALVTFNGRVFDWPLLETRYLMARRTRPALRPAAHLDLLLGARRIWRGHLESCSLGSLERAVLRHDRDGDVPGWQVPSLFFAYLRHGLVPPLVQVFQHNLDDVLSLTVLLGHLGQLLASPRTAAQHAVEQLGVARLFEDGGYLSEAVDAYEAALAAAEEASLRRAVLARLASLHKRQGRREVAAGFWRQLVALGLDDVAPLVELAKHSEHRRRDVWAAIGLVQEALTVLELREPRSYGGAQPARADLERRLARLVRKAARSGGPPDAPALEMWGG